MGNENISVALTPDHHRERYAEHARRLQTWIGAYGVGLAAILVTQVRATLEAIWKINPTFHGKELADAHHVASLVALAVRGTFSNALSFIALALALQVALLLLNKMTQLELAHPPQEGEPSRRWARWSATIGGWAWLDLLADLLSIGLLGWATFVGLSCIFVVA